MIEKVLILELKEDYAIAMEEGGSIVRVKRKSGLSVGDKIYILPEDLFQQAKNDVVVPFIRKQAKKNYTSNKKMWSRMISAAAIFVMIITVLLPQTSFRAYACASFDGMTSIQMELDRNGQIVKIYSPDKSISDKELLALKGKYLEQVGSEIYTLCKSESILVGYALLNTDSDNKLEETLGSLFGNQQSIVYLQGNPDDIYEAQSKGISLGKYLVGEIEYDELEDILYTLPPEELEQLLTENPGWLDGYLQDDIEDSSKDLEEDSDNYTNDIDESESNLESENNPLDDFNEDEEDNESVDLSDDESIESSDFSDTQDELNDDDLSDEPVSQEDAGDCSSLSESNDELENEGISKYNDLAEEELVENNSSQESEGEEGEDLELVREEDSDDYE